MKILITGSAGFIGFHLVERLVKEGNEVVGIDNINDYYDVNLKYARLSEAGINRQLIKDIGHMVQSSKHPNYRFAKIDITDRTNLEKLFNTEKFTHVINLAAQAGVRYSIENPHAYVQSNIVGFVNILECCRHNKIEHFVYASSSSVYGANSKVPFSEGDRVDHPVSLYAASKKSNELMAHTYSHLYNLPTTALRFFTVYGPLGRPDMAPMLFANAITKGEAIKVFNNGDMERDFTYVDDIVEGVGLVCKQQPIRKNEKPPFSIYNIGNSQPIRLMDFISCLEEQFGLNAQKNFMAMQDGDVKRTWADTSALEKRIQYKPNTVIEEGVKKFVKWYQEYFGETRIKN